MMIPKGESTGWIQTCHTQALSRVWGGIEESWIGICDQDQYTNRVDGY